MNNFLEYIESSFKNMKETESLYKYKQKLIAEMTDRANELVATGLRDDKIIAQIIMGEYPDLVSAYQREQNTKKKKGNFLQRSALAIVGIICFVFGLVVTFLAVSFATGAWSRTWLILVGGIFIALIVAMIIFSSKLIGKTGKFTIPSRLMCIASVFLFAVLYFLVMTLVFHVKGSWISFIFAVPLSLILDVILSVYFNKKTGILSVLIYLPVIFTLLYAALSIAGIIPWHPGWLLILLGVFIDMVIAVVRLLKINKETKEEDYSWSEE